jgi:hypothetical protein
MSDTSVVPTPPLADVVPANSTSPVWGSRPSNSTSPTTYPCAFCDTVLSSQSNRTRHVKRKHPASRMQQLAASLDTMDGGERESDETVAVRRLSSVTAESRSAVSARKRSQAETATVSVASPRTSSRQHMLMLGDCVCVIMQQRKRFKPAVTIIEEANGDSMTHDAEHAQARAVDDDTRSYHQQHYDGLDEDADDPDDESADQPESTQPGDDLASTDDDAAPSGSSAVSAKLAMLVEDRDRPTCVPDDSIKRVSIEAALPFLAWLSEPPATEVERLVKARRITKDSQLQPIRWNLRFIFSILIGQGMCSAAHIPLKVLTSVECCKAVHQAMQQRNAGPCRVHTVMLLIKKIIVYLSAIESIRLRIYSPPTTMPAYTYVSSLCSESSVVRKQMAADRAVLGTATLPTNDVDANGGAQGQERTFPAQQTMTTTEMKVLSSGVLKYLQTARDDERSRHSSKHAQRFAAYLVTAILCLGFAPRSQVLAQIKLGTSFDRGTDGRYWIKLSAQHSKNQKPVCLPIPQSLTMFCNHYIAVARPTIMRFGQAAARTGGADDATDETSSSSSSASSSSAPSSQHVVDDQFMFLKKNGTGPRAEFSEWTRYVSQQELGRPISAHTFRSSVITAYYESGATQSQMSDLARYMAHSDQVQKQYYYRPEYVKNVVTANDKLQELLVTHADAAAVAEEKYDDDDVIAGTDALNASEDLTGQADGRDDLEALDS